MYNYYTKILLCVYMCHTNRSLRSSGLDIDLELVKHIKENYIHRVHQAVQVSNVTTVIHL